MGCHCCGPSKTTPEDLDNPEKSKHHVKREDPEEMIPLDPLDLNLEPELKQDTAGLDPDFDTFLLDSK